MEPGVDYIGISTPFYCNDGHGLFLLHKEVKIAVTNRGVGTPEAVSWNMASP